MRRYSRTLLVVCVLARIVRHPDYQGQLYSRTSNSPLLDVREVPNIAEVFAYVGKVKAARRHKVQADVLMLAFAREFRKEQGAREVRAILA